MGGSPPARRGPPSVRLSLMPHDSDLRTKAPYAAWREGVIRQLGEDGFERRLRTRTEDGVVVEPLYAPDCVGVAAEPTLVPSRAGAWVIRQHLDLDADQGVLNEALRDDLANDVTSLHFTSADPKTLNTLDAALEGAAIDHIELSFGGALAGEPAATFLRELWERRETPLDARRASLGADHAVARMRHGIRVGRVSAAQWFDDGLPLAAALGVALAAGAEYIRTAEGRGIVPSHAAAQLEFEIGVGSRLFENVAAIRAARLLWVRLLELSEAADTSTGPRLVVREAQRGLSTKDPESNLFRGTATVWSGAIGGADVIMAEPFDLLGARSPLGRRLARNTHLVLREEGQLHRVADPAAGSWAFETLTDQFAARAWGVLQEIENEGGYTAARKRGLLDSRIQAAADARKKQASRRAGGAAK